MISFCGNYLYQPSCTGFAGLTPLHEAVLLDSVESVNDWISCSDKDERNFIGQTPMHLAVMNSRDLLALVKAGHNLGATDIYGLTPLHYAVFTNQEESLMTLLEACADSGLVSDLESQCNLITYAACWGRWNIIFRFLCWSEVVFKKEISESLAKHAISLLFKDYDHRIGSDVPSHQFLAKCGSVDFTIDAKNNSLLHYARSVEDVEALLEHGFTLINHVNSEGWHALMSVAINWCQPYVIQKLLDAGSEINLKDNFNHTTLYYVLRNLPYFDLDSNTPTPPATTETLRILLANDADILCGDSCRCACSPNGCFPSTPLICSVPESWMKKKVTLSIWSLEWLRLVSGHRGTSDARNVLLSFIRKAKFDELNMTHVCCNRLRFGYPSNNSMPDPDIDEILDEESEFIEILENEMALISSKVYATLLGDWMIQIKDSLLKACENNDEFLHYENTAPVLLPTTPLLKITTH